MTTFDQLRTMSGGRLTQSQVTAANELIAACGESTVMQMLGGAIVRKVSDSGIKLIKSFEGLELKAYKDIVGVVTIGYGHTKTAKMGQVITEQQADQLMRNDLAVFEKGVSELVKSQLTANQFDALVSIAYNIGLGNLSKSTLIKKVNAGDYAGASDEFLRWNRAGGKVVQGLVNRRRAERNLFLS